MWLSFLQRYYVRDASINGTVYCLHKEMGTSEKAYAFLLGIKNNQKNCVDQD